jgi:hypothetical protein
VLQLDLEPSNQRSDQSRLRRSSLLTLTVARYITGDTTTHNLSAAGQASTALEAWPAPLHGVPSSFWGPSTQIVLGGGEGDVQHSAVGRGARLAALEGGDQRALNPKDDFGVQIRVALDEHVGDQVLEAGGLDHEVHARRPYHAAVGARSRSACWTPYIPAPSAYRIPTRAETNQLGVS